MSFKRYYNQEQVEGTTPTFGEDFSSEVNINVEIVDTELRLGDVEGNLIDDIQVPTSQEVHIYSADNLLRSSYEHPIKYNSNGSYPVLKVTPERDLRDLGIEQGVYSINYNFLNKFVEDCKIEDISGDRTEIKISKRRTRSPFNRAGIGVRVQDAFRDLNTILSNPSILNSFSQTGVLPELVLNFKDNELYNVINYRFEGNRFGEEIETLQYPRGFISFGLSVLSTTYVPIDDGVTTLNTWRYFVEVYTPAIGESLPTGLSFGTPTGRVRKYMLKLNQNSDGNLIWQAGSTIFGEGDTPLPGEIPVNLNGDIQIINRVFNSNDLRLTYKKYNFNIETYDTFVVKLDRPLDNTLGLNSILDVDGRVYDSYIEKIIAFPLVTEDETVDFSQPNFSLDITELKGGNGTDWSTWDSLLDVNPTTSQQLINHYFSGSLGNIKLNIDYSDFANFVHFSSATERIDNFFYKIQQIETYNNRINTLESVSGSEAITNISQSIVRRDRIIGGFDDFEHYLYYSSDANNYTHWSSSANIIEPYPKSSTFPHILYGTTTSQGESWYAGVYASASVYDEFNDSRLRNVIPIHLQNDEKTAEYITFVDMIGQHFDIQWSYIKSLTDINKREEHPKDGMADELLKSVASSLGWKLSNGYSDVALWKYTLGVESDGTLYQSGDLKSKARKQITEEIWRRIVNNLPMLYKTKGTARSIKALLSSYGIPQAFLKIREWGGPTISTRKNVYEHERFVNKLELSPSKYLTAPWDTINLDTPNSIEVIGKMPKSNYHILRMDAGSSTIDLFWDYQSDETARIRLNVGGTNIMSSSYVPYKLRRDASFVITSGSNISIHSAWVDDWGTILANPTATLSSDSNFNTTWNAKGTIRVPGTTTTSTASIQELRYFRDAISNEIVQEHAKNREAYFSDDNTTDLDIDTSFDKLVFRVFPDSRIATTSSYIESSHPNQRITQSDTGLILSASLTNITSDQLVGEVDTQFVTVPSMGALNLMNNKIRIESASLKGQLNPDKSYELSEFDYAPTDSNLLGTYFSTTDTVNFDIYNSEGYFEADDWVGDPDNRYNDDYPLLKFRAKNYFQKYTSGTAIDLILDMLSRYDMSVFDQIKQLLPARVDWHKGILIEPHIFERNKYRRNRDITISRHMYDGVISVVNHELTASRLDYDVASIDLYDYQPSTYQYQIANLSSSISCSVSTVSTFVSASVRATLTGGSGDVVFSSADFNAASLSFYEAPTKVKWLVESTLEPVFLDGVTPTPSASVDNIDVNTSTIALAAGYTIDGGYDSEERIFILSGAPASTTYSFKSSSILEVCTTNTTYVNQTNGYWEYSPTGSTVLKHKNSSIYKVPKYFYSTEESASLRLPYSSSMIAWEGQDDRLPLSMENLFYNGCRITSDSLTTDSTETPDGGPVVEITEADPNTLVYSTQTPTDGGLDTNIGSARNGVRQTPEDVLVSVDIRKKKQRNTSTTTKATEFRTLEPLPFKPKTQSGVVLRAAPNLEPISITKILSENNNIYGESEG